MPDSREPGTAYRDWRDRVDQAYGDDAVEPDEQLTQDHHARAAREWQTDQSGRSPLDHQKEG